MEKVEPISRLISEFSHLPGVGKKTATRYAYYIINNSLDKAKSFTEAIMEAKNKVKFCSVCGAYTDHDVCYICNSRKHNTICVVKDAKDVSVIEKSGCFDGVYHVLGGTLNPSMGIGPADLKIRELLARIAENNVSELIIATNPDIEGDVTAMYIANLVKPLGVRVTRIAQGVAMGSEIEYADDITLSRAMEDRKEI
ncbi:MAG: recombination mediator RecR [Clostridia bacterium]